MNPVVISFHGDTRDAGIFQWLQGFNSTGKGTGEDLAGVEQIAGNQDKVNLLSDGIGHNAAEHTEKIFVAFGFI